MNFEFSEEQTALRDTLLRYLQKNYGFEQRREIIRSTDGWSRAHWKQFAEMGLTAIGLPEAYGGYGLGGPFDTYVVMEAFGRALVVEPYLASVVLAADLIAHVGSGAQKSALLPKVASGELQLALAHQEPGARYELAHVATKSVASGNGYVLDGAKTVVLNGAAADRLIVSARTAGGERDEAGISLFLVDPKSSGVSIHGYPTQDGQRAADITLKGVQVSADALLGQAGAALPAIEHQLQHAIAALCAEAVGAMGALLEITGAYLKTRKQFGVPIGSFQALQHRMADMLMQLESARSMAYLIAARIGSADLQERRRAVAAAKALVGQAARHVGQQAVQLHGGIGVTDELNVSHYFKRLTMIDLTFGDAAHHLARYSDLMLAA
ncbi:MAG TPA: acyl-CoA dehydrogenase family protein [Nevskiaceae bacterium]|nr:acyl-CoA dehydrogenase family protein [Nevskiaceae bacterium]